MRVFISHSHQDKAALDQIISRLEADGHDVWVDSLRFLPGDNLYRKIEEGLDQADALIVVISENSFRSEWVQHEFAATAFQQISKRERRIVPVKIDESAMPGYLADLVYVAWRKNPDKTLSHYIVKRLPRFSDGAMLDEVLKLLEEQDANALGLNVEWIDGFAELPRVLREIVSTHGS